MPNEAIKSGVEAFYRVHKKGSTSSIPPIVADSAKEILDIEA